MPCRQYKPRRRKAVPLEEQTRIAEACLQEQLSQQDVARRHRITVQLVRDLVYEAKHQPEKAQSSRARQQEVLRQRQKIIETASKLLDHGCPVVRAQQICDAVRLEAGYDVGIKNVRQVLKQDLGLSFLKVKKLHPQANSIKVKV